jgi:hypothetical protein
VRAQARAAANITASFRIAFSVHRAKRKRFLSRGCSRGFVCVHRERLRSMCVCEQYRLSVSRGQARVALLVVV